MEEDTMEEGTMEESIMVEGTMEEGTWPLEPCMFAPSGMVATLA